MRVPSNANAAACFGQVGSAPDRRDHRVRRERQNSLRLKPAAVRALMRLPQGVRRTEQDRATTSEGVSNRLRPNLMPGLPHFLAYCFANFDVVRSLPPMREGRSC
jgi:hypothetical protein